MRELRGKVAVVTGGGSGIGAALARACSPYGLERTKQVLWANLGTASLAAAIELEDRNRLMLGLTDNLPEAIRSFDQEHEPVYTDEPRRDLSGRRE